MPIQTNARINHLSKVRTDLSDVKEALNGYWSRGLSDTDNKVADVQLAVEALLRAVSTLMLVVEDQVMP